MVEYLRMHKRTVTVVFSLAGIGIMTVYSLCSGSCDFLRGTLFDVDLKYLGVVFISLVMVSGMLGMDTTCALLLSMGAGGEAFLLGFQVINGVYCPFCLAYAAIVIFLFAIRLERIRPATALLFAIAGFLMFHFFFSGSIVPAYAEGSWFPLPCSQSSEG